MKLKNLKSLKWIGLGVLATSAVVIPSVMVVSCSNNSETTQTNTHEIKNIGFNPITSSKQKSNNSIEYITSAKDNPDAKKKADEIFRNYTVNNLKKDFYFAISGLFDCYEYKNQLNEVEIERIDVVDYNGDNQEVLLNVVYEVENDANDKEYLVSQHKKLKLNYDFGDQTTIDKLKSLLSNKNNVDDQERETVEDLYEFYFGEKDDNDFDDIGIFDKLNYFRGQNNGQGSILGYNIDLESLKPEVSADGSIKQINRDQAKLVNQDLTKSYFVPSVTTSYFFYATIEDNLPIVKASNQKLNIVFDNNKLMTVTKDQFVSQINSGDLSAKVTALNNYIKDIPNSQLISPSMLESLDVELDSSNQFVNIKFKFKNEQIKLNETNILSINYHIVNSSFKQA